MARSLANLASVLSATAIERRQLRFFFGHMSTAEYKQLVARRIATARADLVTAEFDGDRMEAAFLRDVVDAWSAFESRLQMISPDSKPSPAGGV